MVDPYPSQIRGQTGGPSRTDCAALRIGQVAPNFSARATTGAIHPVRLSRTMGALILSPRRFHPPFAPANFWHFPAPMTIFSARQCALVALSVDSLFSHLAWVRAINDHFGVAIRFPVIEDPTLEIGRAFGMLGHDDADASSVRAAYILDPNGVVPRDELLSQQRRAIGCGIVAHVGRLATR